MSPDEYCQQKATASGSSFYYSFLFLPERQRKAITALYAFCREVDDVVDECTESDIAHRKLNWWREEIHRLFSATPQHPVTQALAPMLQHYPMNKAHFLAIIDGMQMDLEKSRYANFEELYAYCYRAASVVGLLSVEIFGYENPKTRDYAETLGLAFQLTNILRDVGEDIRLGRIYIPIEDLKRFNINESELMEYQTTDNIRKLFEYQAERAYHYYEQAFAALPDADRSRQKSGVIMAAIYRTLLDEIKKDGFNVLQQKIKLTPLRKLWIAWQTARKEKRYLEKKTA